MNIISFAQNILEIEELISSGVTEVIVSCRELSRFSTTTLEELINILNNKHKFKCKITLEWDALFQEEKFQFAKKTFLKLPLHEINSIRVQDPGTVNFIKNNYDWIKIQLILETGNHNLIGLKRWSDFLGNQLERLILSNELSKEILESYAKNLNTPIEVLVLGRILLFYSPRSLLHKVLNNLDEFIEASGTSEESPHSGFPLLENAHGTFMFNVKDLSLLENIEELNNINIINYRIDLRFDDLKKDKNKIIEKIKNPLAELKLNGPRPFVKGFYNINKTDVLFVKLKNKRIQRKDENYIGEIIDVERDAHLCVMLKNSIVFKEEFNVKMVTPEGKVKKTSIKRILNSEKKVIQNAENETIILLPYVNGITVKTQIYFDSN
jgi:putative protease